MRIAATVGVALVAALGAIQLVPVERTNPPVTGDVRAPPAVKRALRVACYDCHSNETVWPWYSRVAPASWLLHHDVAKGRAELNFSSWESLSPERKTKKLREMVEEVRGGDMPPWYYVRMHRAAALSPSDKERIESWAAAGGGS